MNQASFAGYDPGGFYDEMFRADGTVRPEYAYLLAQLEQIPREDFLAKQFAAERALMSMGITFNVYSENQGVERIMPIDIIPRIINGEEWKRLEEGLIQRVTALNLFVDDLYHDQQILKDGVIPRHVVESSRGFLPRCMGLNPPQGIWCHITGSDLIRGDDGGFMVLEDNLRCPSGVSYMLENREILKKSFPEVLEKAGVQHVSDYPTRLLDMLQYLSGKAAPTVVVLTPGTYNAAYFEHSYLAQQMGVHLVESSDLIVVDGQVKMRTTSGFETVDVIYRRIDDTFLDPQAFNPDSLIGIPGIFEAYRNGKVALANAPGTGVADDKVVYAYVPRIIEYYLKQEAII
ncbi:MAG: circularly permuted type 2 ATP-grasp protein, partial [Phaeodactylibacter sp.]|nr:circularly permuted type 2 ATP-grasp protein [Phaeodactylibacter sp.]